MSIPLSIVGSGFAVPEFIQTSEDLALELGREPSWIIDRTGVRERRVAAPELEVEDLAAQASRLALSNGEAPDLLIYAASAVRQAIPDTSVFLQRQLGFDGVASFSMHATCISFLVALQTAAALLATGMHRRILISSAELGSRVRNFDQPESAALLGDGAAAIVVEAGAGRQRLDRYCMESWPKGAELSEIRGGGLRRLPHDERTDREDFLFDMNGPALYRMTVRHLRGFLERFLDGIRPEEIDLVVPHQTSARGFRFLQALGFSPEKTINILSRFGNCGAASLPMALCTAIEEERIKKGDTVLLIGTAAGLKIGAALLRW